MGQGAWGREPGGGAGSFNGIFKDGFKLEVISMFMFERRKAKSRVLARRLVNVRACVRTRGLAAITASCKHLSQPPLKDSVYQLDK